MKKQKLKDSKIDSINDTYYVSPELAAGGVYSRKAEVWALGMLLLEMAELGRP